jgi:hypothetical protein
VFYERRTCSIRWAIRRLHRGLTGIAELNPLEPNITLTLMGDGKGQITVDGVARNDFANGTELAFEFTIDQTYLEDIAASLCAVDDRDCPVTALPGTESKCRNRK